MVSLSEQSNGYATLDLAFLFIDIYKILQKQVTLAGKASNIPSLFYFRTILTL